MPIITLTTDFGQESVYVGVMKGVIYALHPAALPVDLTHQVTPQNVLEGAFLLHTAYRQFPPDTVHLAVVDPGVGTTRRALALDVPEIGRFVGPDNGLFSYIIGTHPNLTAREITNPAFMRHPVSATFHGRDVFAPTAALLARGVPFEQVGPLLDRDTLVRMHDLWPTWTKYAPDCLRTKGHVVHIDHFGNLITNIPQHLFDRFGSSGFKELYIKIIGSYDLKTASLVTTYGQALPGQVIVLFGSSGFLEIACVNGRADTSPGGPIVKAGQLVSLEVFTFFPTN